MTTERIDRTVTLQILFIQHL